MPKYKAEQGDARRLRGLLLDQDPELKHLRVRKLGALLTVESGPSRDPVRHVRFRRDTVHLWILEVANHRGKWQKTGLRDQLPTLVEVVTDTFPWVLSKIE